MLWNGIEQMDSKSKKIIVFEWAIREPRCGLNYAKKIGDYNV